METQQYYSGKFQYTINDDGTARIIGYRGNDKSIVIPQAVKDESSVEREITSIGNVAFYQCFSLEEITIPDTIKTISAHPFSLCNNLRKFIVSSTHPTLTAIDGVLFEKSNDRLVCFPTGFSRPAYKIPEGIKGIGDNAFHELREFVDLTDKRQSVFGKTEPIRITVPKSITNIDDHAFEECFRLTEINMPDNITGIGNNAFEGCTGLNEITIPESVKVIGKNAFCRSGLTEIHIPSSVVFIDEGAFRRCEQLENVILPDHLRYIPHMLFEACSALKTISIPNNVRLIGSEAFMGCSALKSVMIPLSVKIIEHLAFSGCQNLTNLTISPNVNFIGEDAFSERTQLIVYRGSYAEQYAAENHFKYTCLDSDPVLEHDKAAIQTTVTSFEKRNTEPVKEKSTIGIHYAVDHQISPCCWIGHDKWAGTKILIKSINQSKIISDPTTIQSAWLQHQFLTSSLILKSLNGIKGIPEYVDLIWNSGLPYLIMKYIEGSPLSEIAGTVRSWDEIKHIGIQLLTILHQVHQAGIAHLDIHPKNILITPQEGIKLIDFGSAQQLIDGSAYAVSVNGQFTPP